MILSPSGVQDPAFLPYCLFVYLFYLIMSFDPNNNRDILAPRNRDVNLQIELSDRTSLVAPRMPAYIHVRDDKLEYTSPIKPRTIPRKPLPNYERLYGHTQTPSLDSIKTFQSEISQQSYFNEEEESRDVGVERTWRFYGTFACLALVNFICAIVRNEFL